MIVVQSLRVFCQAKTALYRTTLIFEAGEILLTLQKCWNFVNGQISPFSLPGPVTTVKIFFGKDDFTSLKAQILPFKTSLGSFLHDFFWQSYAKLNVDKWLEEALWRVLGFFRFRRHLFHSKWYKMARKNCRTIFFGSLESADFALSRQISPNREKNFLNCPESS